MYSLNVFPKLPFSVIIREWEEGGVSGEVKLPLLGIMYNWTSSWAALSSLVRVAANFRVVGTCNCLHFYSSMHSPHRWQFLQRKWSWTVGKTITASRIHGFLHTIGACSSGTYCTEISLSHNLHPSCSSSFLCQTHFWFFWWYPLKHICLKYFCCCLYHLPACGCLPQCHAYK